MPNNIASNKARILEDYIKNTPSALQPGRRKLFEIDGKREPLETYRLPLDLLHYSIRNGRFAAELKELETSLGRNLDPDIAEDAAEIEELLLKDKNMKEMLKKDIERIGQLEPGVITHDGSIIDGNRRCAVMRECHRSKGEAKYEYFEAYILPETITDKDLWRIEAGIQLATDLQATYGPVNELLKIREGTTYGLTPTSIAQTLGGKNTKDGVKCKLDLLALIEQYLTSIQRPYVYSLAERKVEHFIDLQNIMRSKNYVKMSAEDKAKLVQVAFRLVENDFPHLAIRKIKKAIVNRDVFLEWVDQSLKVTGDTPGSGSKKEGDMKGEIEELEEIVEAEGPSVVLQEEDGNVDDLGQSAMEPDDELQESCEANPETEKGEEVEEDVAFETNIRNGLEDAFGNMIERADIREQKSKPKRLLTRVVSTLETLNQLEPERLEPLKPQVVEAARLAKNLEEKVRG